MTLIISDRIAHAGVGFLASPLPIFQERVTPFIGYLNKHRQRIVNYGYYQAEGISIGSGAIESTVK